MTPLEKELLTLTRSLAETLHDHGLPGNHPDNWVAYSSANIALAAWWHQAQKIIHPPFDWQAEARARAAKIEEMELLRAAAKAIHQQAAKIVIPTNHGESNLAYQQWEADRNAEFAGLEPIHDNPGYKPCSCEDYPCCGH